MIRYTICNESSVHGHEQLLENNIADTAALTRAVTS